MQLKWMLCFSSSAHNLWAPMIFLLRSTLDKCEWIRPNVKDGHQHFFLCTFVQCCQFNVVVNFSLTTFKYLLPQEKRTSMQSTSVWVPFNWIHTFKITQWSFYILHLFIYLLIIFDLHDSCSVVPTLLMWLCSGQDPNIFHVYFSQLLRKVFAMVLYFILSYNFRGAVSHNWITSTPQKTKTKQNKNSRKQKRLSFSPLPAASRKKKCRDSL